MLVLEVDIPEGADAASGRGLGRKIRTEGLKGVLKGYVLWARYFEVWIDAELFRTWTIVVGAETAVSSEAWSRVEEGILEAMSAEKDDCGRQEVSAEEESVVLKMQARRRVACMEESGDVAQVADALGLSGICCCCD
jgi:hypothetical protein